MSWQEQVAKNRESLEKVANSDLPLSDDIAELLALADAEASAHA